MAIVPWAEISADTLFGNNQLYRFIKLLLGGKEDSSNKTSSWNSTTNNTRYPTEKLVKDTLDGKADKNHTHTIANVTNLQSTLDSKVNSSDIAKSSYTLSSWETTNFSTCDVTFYKQLNMVTCIYHINTVTFANKNDHIVTASEIPSAYRPSSVFYQDICTYGGQKLDGLITVGTNGSMKIRMGTANTSMNVYGSFTYIVG